MTTTITYNPETRDYAMQLDGELVGFARTYHDAEVTLDQLRLEQAQHAAPLLDPALEPIPAPGKQLAFYSERYKTAKQAMEVAKFLNGYAASKEVA